MTSRRIARLLLLAPMFAGTLVSAQTMYKWVDDKGHVTYSDQPPVGKVKKQEVVNIVSTAPAPAVRQVADQDVQFKKRQEETAKKQAETTKKEQFEAVRLESCSRARGELRAVRENVPIARMSEAGEKVVLDPGARDAEGRRLESFIEESCKDASG